MKNVFYFQRIADIGGIETFLYNIAKKYNAYDITIIYKTGNYEQIKRLRKYVRVKEYKGEIIKCDKIFLNYNIDILDKVDAKEVVCVLHGDYLSLINNNQLSKETLPIDNRIDKYIGVSQLVCDNWYKLTGLKAELCYNPYEKEEQKEPLRLVSATRLSNEKGRGRLQYLANKLDENNIPYEWFIFTNSKEQITGSNVFFMGARLNILPYVKRADYLVQMSDNEGYCYSIIEALTNGVKVITTKLPVLKELGVNEDNAILIDFDMSNLDINKIYNEKDKLISYKEPKDIWEDLLVKGESTYRKEQEQMFRLKVIIKRIFYSKYDELVDIQGKKEQGYLHEGDIIVVKSKQEMEYLCGDNKPKIKACELIEEIVEKPKKTKKKKGE